MLMIIFLNSRLRVGSAVADRDIVQFVPFRNYVHVSSCFLPNHYIHFKLQDESCFFLS